MQQFNNATFSLLSINMEINIKKTGINYIYCKRMRLSWLTTVIILFIPINIFKKLHMVKIIDMFNIAIWKFYYKLMNDLLPLYFNYMKPNVTVICDHYNVRNPKFYLSVIKRDFVKRLIEYCLTKLLNENDNISKIADKVFEQTFCMFKSLLKNKEIAFYYNKCIDSDNCVHAIERI